MSFDGPAGDGPACDVALVSMPWAPVLEPSLGLGILKSCLDREGIAARVFHFAPELLRWTTLDTYQYLADSWGLNDFVFSGEIDRELGEQQRAAVVERVMTYAREGRKYDAYPTAESVLDLIMTARHEVVPRLVASAADAVLASGARMVGFSCLFDQTMASLALATAVKRRDPDITVVFGGYALEGPPGTEVVKAFPCVDHLVVGDGEEEIVRLARWALGQGPAASGPGGAQPGASPGTSPSAPPGAPPRIIRARKVPLDDSPVPDYSDWYRDLAALEAAHSIRIGTEVLPVESSRGCWWGQTKHCVFCGIDDETLQYRFKDPGLVLGMLDELRARHGNVTFRFSDYIMPKAYYTGLLPELAAREPRFKLHAEIKANQPPERVELLARAGFVAVQPGIESFATPVLKEMDKGVRGIDNVSLLKSGYAHRLTVQYNILYGLPGDQVDAYAEMLRQLPRLYHLTPPVSRTETVVTRFAPLQENPGRFGIRTRPVHHECYDALFSAEFLSATGFSLDNYAYYFQRNFPYSRELKTAYWGIVVQVDHWKSLHRTRFVELSYEEHGNHGDRLRVHDSRFSDGETYALSVTASAILREVGHRPLNISRVRRAMAAAGTEFSDAAFDAAFDAALGELDEKRLIWREGELILGLALPKEVSDRHQESGWPKEWGSLYT
ncbi:RiPP maturation radical SAM C-methyltransferase [Streptomyces sp. NPDC048172]|uniref:RiPP maturation radical SAM C-methyltransferase n=1 Tax=Streptomyces sp. NPDC048172 TaxID=3365505 RepID=UPI00371621C4